MKKGDKRIVRESATGVHSFETGEEIIYTGDYDSVNKLYLFSNAQGRVSWLYKKQFKRS